MNHPQFPTLVAIFMICAGNWLLAEDAAVRQDVNIITPDPSVEAWIPGAISDGTEPAAAPPAVLPDFAVKSTTTRRLSVVKPPPMEGLPPVTGTITETVQIVEDPKLAVPPAAVAAVEPESPAATSGIGELAGNRMETRLVFVSATVYDRARTLLRCYPNGGAAKQITAWSNLDFNHFSGFTTYQVKGRDGATAEHALLMGIGNEDTRRMAEWLEKHDKTYQPPVIPEIPDLAVSGPAFVVTEGDAADKDLMGVLEGMHALYRNEGARMADAHAARIKAYEERKAHLLANPPKPEDVTVRIWKRDVPSTKPQKAGGAR